MRNSNQSGASHPLRDFNPFSFDLSREVVAISLDLFDRYLATRSNTCSGNTALLVSLTTLHISIKIHDRKKIKITTLANLSRGQFGIEHIEKMEWQVLAALGWKLHPPTQYSFVYHLLHFLPLEPGSAIKRDVHELSRYLTELAVCDSFFIGTNNSTVAFAAILNVLDQISLCRITVATRERFLREVITRVGLHHLDASVETARDRLRSMLNVTAGSDNQPPMAYAQHQQDNDIGSLSSSGSNSSTYKESRYFDPTINSATTNSRQRSNSTDSWSRRRCMANASPMSRGQRSSSPIVAGVQ